MGYEALLKAERDGMLFLRNRFGAKENESVATWIERLVIERDAAVAELERMLHAVYVANNRIQCDDVNDENWFDAKDRILRALAVAELQHRKREER